MMRQLDLDGNEHVPRSDPPGACEPEPLFHAPSTMRGQQTLESARAAAGRRLAALRAIPCEVCGAAIGRPCKRPSGHAVFGGDVHAPRRAAAMENETREGA